MPATVWTSEREAAFLEALRATRSVKRACAAAGVDRATAYRRRVSKASFCAAWDRAWGEAADATDVAMSAILADPAASSAAKIRAAAALRSARRFRDRPWGSGIAAKAAARSTGKAPAVRQGAPPEPVPAEVAARIEAARTTAAEAIEPFRERLAESVYQDALSLGTLYVAVFAGRGMRLDPHLAVLVIALADSAIKNLLIVCGPGSGKSSLISVAYPCWLLGRDPSHTILEVSAAENLVDGFRLGVAGIIEGAPEYRALFPGTRPDKERGWSSERGLFVQGHGAGDPDASLFVCGVLSSTLTGKHARTLILDDLHDRENSASAAQREKIVAAYYDTLIGRGDPQGARFVVAGRRFGEGDLYGHFEAAGGWVVLRLPAERPGTECAFDVEIPDGLDCALRALCEPDDGTAAAVIGEEPGLVVDIVVPAECDTVKYEPLDLRWAAQQGLVPAGTLVRLTRLAPSSAAALPAVKTALIGDDEHG